MGYQAAHQASRPSELANRMAVFRAADGSRRWDVAGRVRRPPVLNGRTIYAPPGAWDLSDRPEAAASCWSGPTAAGSSPAAETCSSSDRPRLGYIDLATSMETQNYGGIRPGCWIAGIPAGGVLAMPDAASWCTCSYLNQGTLVLRPAAGIARKANRLETDLKRRRFGGNVFHGRNRLPSTPIVLTRSEVEWLQDFLGRHSSASIRLP